MTRSSRNTTPAFELSKLLKPLLGPDWDNELKACLELDETQQEIKLLGIAKSWTKYLADEATKINDDDLKNKMGNALAQFTAYLSNSSEALNKALSQIQGLQASQQVKYMKLLELLQSDEVAKIFVHHLKNYLKQSPKFSKQKKEGFDDLFKPLFKQNIDSCMEDINRTLVNTGYTPEGRIIKGIMHLLALMVDVVMISAGSQPVFGLNNPTAGLDGNSSGSNHLLPGVDDFAAYNRVNHRNQ